MLFLAFTWDPGTQAQNGPTAGPDLKVESISVEPPVPAIGQEVTIKFVVKNAGTSTTGKGFTTYLYIDPADRPPGPSTPGYPYGVGTLGADGSFEGSRTHTFNSGGCDHKIYVWVDRDDQVAEGNEGNNLLELPLCVDVECEVDDFENDNQCSAANWLVEGAGQAHSFCHPTDQNLADPDWIKFTALTGVTYTLGTSNWGQHADPQIALRSSCDGGDLLTGEKMLSWQPSVNGVYYARLENDSAPQGPLTAYSLTLTSTTGLTDNYEPDDTCAAARDIPPDGTKQTHLFQAPGDTDWVKFTTQAGESFAMVASNPGTGVNPVITLFSSCNQSRSKTQLAQGTNRVEANSTGGQIYYARIKNQNPDRFGASAHYDISVLASACAADDLEEDDTFNQAQSLAVGDTGQTHNVCPAGDQDWVKFDLQADTIYVIKTGNLGFAADTVLELFDDQGTLIATNDDYDYVEASRLVYEPATSGTYYARVTHRDPAAAGPNTNYDITIETGVCNPDGGDGGNGDNGPGDAVPLSANGSGQNHNFCANPLSTDIGDQDWVSFNAVAGGTYRISTADLGPNSDTILRLYAADGNTLLQDNDDKGPGRSAQLVFTPTVAGTYYVQVTQYNSNIIGREASYNLQLEENIPPTPTPTPTLTPTPTPTPTPLPTVDPSSVRTLVLVNRQRLAALYGNSQTGAVMAKLYELADNPQVSGAVVQVEQDPAVAAAYADWTASQSSLENNDLANAVAGAIRNAVLAFSHNAPDLQYLVIVGDDRVIPFRRIAEGTLSTQEQEYAADVSADTTVAAALAQDLILTDDYYADREPSTWKGNEIYLPDYAAGRLIEEPEEIIAFIDSFLADPVNDVSKVLVTGYDFIQDSADLMETLFENDDMSTDTLIGTFWQGDALRQKQLEAVTRFDLQSINGHSTHVSTGTPDLNDIQASEVVSASADLTGALVYAVGCHAGLNDPGQLDLPQAFVKKGANYVGNTGYGWGGGGIVYSEALMRNFTRELLRDTQAEIGPALVAAKQKYWDRAFIFGAYDAKVLMQSTLYGLPMAEITSGGTLSEDDPFPSADTEVQPPSAFGDVNRGTLSYGLPGSFGAFGESSTNEGDVVDLDNNTYFSAGAPVQPHFYADVTAPAAGSLRGLIFRGGVYTDVTTFDPVIAQAQNEYVLDSTEPGFQGSGWFPQMPFALQRSTGGAASADTVVLSLGQFDQHTGTERLYDRMSLDTFYSDSQDQTPPAILFVDGVLDEDAGQGEIKVETQDDSGISQVVVAYTDNPLSGQGEWNSVDLTFRPATQKWSGTITGTVKTRYFVQVVDAAGNVAVNDNKGQYHPLQAPLPLAQGRMVEHRLYLPTLQR